MANIKTVENKIRELNLLLDPDKAPDHLSSSDCTDLGIISTRVHLTVEQFQNSAQKSQNVKDALKSLDELEQEAKKILKVGKSSSGSSWFWWIILVVGILWFLSK